MTSTSSYSNPEGHSMMEDVPSEVRIGVVSAKLPTQTPPLNNDCLLHGVESAEKSHPTVIINQKALQQIEAHCVSNLDVELGGILLGQAYQHNDKQFVEIVGAIAAVSDDKGPVHFKFSADTWAQIHRDKAIRYAEFSIVGWFHTHPDLGVFYSSDDEIVQATSFTQPWHVGLVVDPVREQASFFGWLDNREIRPISGFYELLPPATDQPRESVINWDVVVDDSWMSPIHSMMAIKRDLPEQADPILSPWFSLILSAMSLAISVAALIIALYLYFNQ